MTAKGKQSSATSQVERREDRIEVRAGGVNESGIDDANIVILIEKSMLIDRSDFYVVNALHVRNLRTDAGIGQPAVLADGFRLQSRGREICKRVSAGVVVVLIVTDKGA